VSRVWVVGPLAWDSVLHVANLPKVGNFTQGFGLTGRPGGTAANVAVGLASSGVRTGFAGYVGQDELSQKLIESLAASEIEELHIKELSGAANHVLILIDDQGERTMVGFTEDRLDQVSIRDVELSPDDYVLFVLWRNCFLEDLHYAQHIGCKVIVGIEALDSVPHITADICIGSGADLPAGIDIEKCLERFDRVVITHGVAGADQYWRENSKTQTLHQPAIPVAEVVDTTGAGDSFLAGYIKGLIDGSNTLEHPMLIGAYWSAQAVASVGSHPPHWSKVSPELPPIGTL